MGITVTPVTSFSEIAKIAETGDLYVMNNSDQANARNRGNIVFDIKDENGDSFGVIIPDTWLPINLANHAQTNLFLKSNVFRNLISQRNLVVVATSSAMKILESNEAKTEQKRVTEYQSSHSRALADTGVTNNNQPTMQISTGGSNITMREHVTVEQALDNRDDNELQRLVATFNAGRVTTEAAVEALQTLTPSMEAAKVAAGNISNTGSLFYAKLSEIISGPITEEEVIEGNA